MTVTVNGTTGNVGLGSAGGGTINVIPVSTATSPTITLPATTGTAVVSTSTTSITTNNFYSGSICAFKNRFINPAMKVDQRNNGAAQTITAAAALAYTVDRWYAYSTGANVTGQRVAGSIASSQFNYQFTGAASTTAIGFGQRIEAINSYDLAGQTATLSVNLANSLLTTVTWTAYYANTADTFGSLASPTVTQIATGTFTVTSTIANYSAQISIPNAATTGIQIVFTVGAQISGTWTIGNAQLELSPVATTFNFRPFGQELFLCQRYLPAFNATSVTSPICSTSATSVTNAYATFKFPANTRTPPTSITSTAATQFSVFTTAATALTAIAFNNASNDAATLNCTVAGTAGFAGYLYANTATAQILFNGCEL